MAPLFGQKSWRAHKYVRRFERTTISGLVLCVCCTERKRGGCFWGTSAVLQWCRTRARQANASTTTCTRIDAGDHCRALERRQVHFLIVYLCASVRRQACFTKLGQGFAYEMAEATQVNPMHAARDKAKNVTTRKRHKKPSVEEAQRVRVRTLLLPCGQMHAAQSGAWRGNPQFLRSDSVCLREPPPFLVESRMPSISHLTRCRTHCSCCCIPHTSPLAARRKTGGCTGESSVASPPCPHAWPAGRARTPS